MRHLSVPVAVLCTALVCVAAPPPVGAVVAARSARSQAPRVNVLTRSAEAVRSLALPPLADAPQAPGSGTAATDLLAAALAERGVAVLAAETPRDARGQAVPSHLLGDAALVELARQSGADAVLAGRVVQWDVQGRGRPDAVVRRLGNYWEVPGDAALESGAAVNLRVLSTRSGRLLFSAQGSFGPLLGLGPREVMDTLLRECLAQWPGAAGTPGHAAPPP